MPDWLRDSFQSDVDVTWSLLVLRLSVSLAFGCLVALIYWRARRPASRDFITTLVMLTILIAMVTLVIGNSVARAFGLVGALSIVRFRTVVEDTRDTAFVILAVAVGMAVGAGYLLVPVVGMPFAAAAAFLFAPRPRASNSLVLTVRVGVGHRPEDLLGKAFEKHLEFSRLHAVSTARQGAALELTYDVRLRQENGAVALVADLNATEGVQGVELGPTESA